MKRHVTTAEVRAHRKKVVEDSKKLTAQLQEMNTELNDYLNDISEMLYDLEKIGVIAHTSFLQALVFLVHYQNLKVFQ